MLDMINMSDLDFSFDQVSKPGLLMSGSCQVMGGPEIGNFYSFPQIQPSINVTPPL